MGIALDAEEEAKLRTMAGEFIARGVAQALNADSLFESAPVRRAGPLPSAHPGASRAEAKPESLQRIFAALHGVLASIVQHKTSKAKYRLPSVFGHDAARNYKAFGLKRNLDVQIDPS